MRARLLAVLTAAVVAMAEPPRGIVRDASGAVVPGAMVELVMPGAGSGTGAILWRSRTGADGRFSAPIETGPAARIRVTAPGLAVWEGEARGAENEIVMSPSVLYTATTVSASPTVRGARELAFDSASAVTVKGEDQIREQPLATIGNVLSGEAGILVQQSTYGQVSPFLRGLTGYQVLTLVDGIRFNNSTFRSGPNQYLAYLDPGQVQKVEAVAGPSGVSWGSDSLGGTINVLSAPPEFAPGKKVTARSQLQLGGGSADASLTGSGRLSLSTARYFWLGGISGQRHGDARAGGGIDSRNVFTRLFGLHPEAARGVFGNRQRETGFRQYGAEGRFAARPRAGELFSINYQRGAQSGTRGYKDLLGGLGRMISTFEPQGLNWLYARYERLGLGWIDSLSGTVSVNSQTDGGRRQNLLVTDPITTDFARARVFGYSGQATAHSGARLVASFGGDLHDEHIASTREVLNPVTRVVSHPRPLYPDGSRYQTIGAFGQGSYQISRSVSAAGGIRFTGVRFATAEDRAFRIPESRQWFRDVTFQSSVRWQVTEAVGLNAVVSRGFRAPNLNDLGALGLNDLGYEIPASEAITAGALLATDAGEGALSKGSAIRPLGAESLMNYEFGARVRSGRVTARAQLFDAELRDPITRRTLLFPAGSVPAALAGLAVTPVTPTAAQRQQGVVTVASAADPRALKAFVNDGRSRYYGAEAMVRVQLDSRLSLEANYSHIVGRDLFPNRNIRRLPPSMGSVRLRHVPSGRRPWVEVSMNAAARQGRLSGGDRDDERIGASFRRADIAAFFAGSRASAWIDPGTGTFRPTGETLRRIQDRVLPVGATINGVRVIDDATRVPLYLATAGWAAVNVRSGLPLGERWQINAAVENLFDHNYRVHGSGIDAPGVQAWVGVRLAF